MDIIQALQEELKIGRHQVEAAVKLIDEGNTIPFIARYRKEATGSLPKHLGHPAHHEHYGGQVQPDMIDGQHPPGFCSGERQALLQH